MAKQQWVGFTVGDGFRLGLGFIFAQILFALICGALWIAGAAALLGLAAAVGLRGEAFTAGDPANTGSDRLVSR